MYPQTYIELQFRYIFLTNENTFVLFLSYALSCTDMLNKSGGRREHQQTLTGAIKICCVIFLSENMIVSCETGGRCEG